MDQEELIRRAKEIIGKPTSEDKDWIITPTKHAGLYRETAPALAGILDSSVVDATSEQYEQFDGNAVAAQARFKRTARLANLAVLLTACGGALVLVVNALSDWRGHEASLMMLGVISAIVGGLGAMWIHRIDAGKYLQAWMSSRARAETHHCACDPARLRTVLRPVCDGHHGGGRRGGSVAKRHPHDPCHWYLDSARAVGDLLVVGGHVNVPADAARVGRWNRRRDDWFVGAVDGGGSNLGGVVGPGSWKTGPSLRSDPATQTMRSPSSEPAQPALRILLRGPLWPSVLNLSAVTISSSPRVAQRIEQPASNRQVGGSSPPARA